MQISAKIINVLVLIIKVHVVTLKAPDWQVKPGECWNEEQGEGGRQELPAPPTHSQHPLD